MVKTIDAHVGGQPFRLIVDGMPSTPGGSMYEKQMWAAGHADRVRRMVLREPRGHEDLSAAVLTEPVTPGSHAGVLFMRASGYVPMSIHGAMALATIALERGLIDPGGDGRHVTFDTVAGTVRAEGHVTGERDAGDAAVTAVSVTNVPSFVLRPGVELSVLNRRFRVDVSFGGAFYAIVDSESAAVSLDMTGSAELRRAARAIALAVEESGVCVHPMVSRLKGVHGVVFTGPSHGSVAALRTVSVLRNGSLDRSAGGTGMSAVMAVLDAMGFLSDEPFVAEGIIGTTLQASVRGRTTVGDYDAIVPVIEGHAWIIGESTWLASAMDPFAGGGEI